MSARRTFRERPRSLYALSQQPRSRRPSKPKAIPGFSLEDKGEDRCRVCGAPATDLHHAVPRSLSRAGRADLRNGLPLCRNCHDAWHAGTPIPRSVFTAEEWAFISTLMGPGWLGRRYPIQRGAERSAFPESRFPVRDREQITVALTREECGVSDDLEREALERRRL